MNKQYKKKSEWIYGKHAVLAALNNKKRKIFRVILCQGITQNIEIKNHKTEFCSKQWFIKTFGINAVHQGICLETEPLPELQLPDIVSASNDKELIIALDQVTDPQNVGTIIRAAAAFKAKAVIIPELKSPDFTPALIKAASGAIEKVPIIKVINLSQSLSYLKTKGYWCVGLDEKGETEIIKIPVTNKIVLVIGSEGKGIRKLVKETCDIIAKIPTSHCFSTISAAQSATIALYEMFSQDLKK